MQFMDVNHNNVRRQLFEVNKSAEHMVE